VKEKLSARWGALRERYWWLDHVVRAYQTYKKNHGDFFAAAITYFSFLALFPAILLGVSIAGFVLQHDQSLQDRLFTNIEKNLPGSFGTTVHDAITQAISARTGVGIVGLVGLAYTGLGWVANLRAAIVGVWGQTPAKIAFVKAKALDSLVLVGLGLGVVLSVGLTAVGTTLADQITNKINVPGGSWLVSLIGLLLPVVGDMLVFSWVLVRLPKATVARPIVFRAALLASVGFEILKIVGSYYIGRVSHSATVGLFGSVIGILVWMDLVARYVLFCTAWTATATRTSTSGVTPSDIDVPADAAGLTTGDAPTRGISPVGTAVSLIAVGFAAGVGAVGYLFRRPAN
jgi:membrane protein